MPSVGTSALMEQSSIPRLVSRRQIRCQLANPDPDRELSRDGILAFGVPKSLDTTSRGTLLK